MSYLTTPFTLVKAGASVPLFSGVAPQGALEEGVIFN